MCHPYVQLNDTVTQCHYSILCRRVLQYFTLQHPEKAYNTQYFSLLYPRKARVALSYTTVSSEGVHDTISLGVNFHL